MFDYRTLLVPYDFSEHAAAALARAVDLQVRFDADLHLVYVLQAPIYAAIGHDSVPFPLPPSEQDDLRRSLRQVEMAASSGATRPLASRANPSAMWRKSSGVISSSRIACQRSLTIRIVSLWGGGLPKQ